METPAKLPPEKLDALVEELEAERQRRIDEKVVKGEAIRVPALSIVVGTPAAANAAIENTRARMQAADREAGRKVREVYFEEPAVLITGVPRPGGMTRVPVCPGADLPFMGTRISRTVSAPRFA
jgi:hypothetical protein